MTKIMSFEKATTLSFTAHLAFILLATLLFGKNNVKYIDVYTVNIVPAATPATQAPEPGPASGTPQPINRQQVPPPKKAPAKDSPWLNEDPSPVKVNKKALARKQAAIAEARHSRELKKLRESQAYKQQKIHDLEQKARLAAIRKQAAKAETILTGQPEPVKKITEAERNKTMAEYGERIQAIIYSNWVYALADENMQLMTIISVTVRKDGVMTINKVAGPSGDRVFDLSALKAIRKTGKVEPPPFERNEEIILNFYPDQ